VASVGARICLVTALLLLGVLPIAGASAADPCRSPRPLPAGGSSTTPCQYVAEAPSSLVYVGAAAVVLVGVGGLLVVRRRRRGHAEAPHLQS
jgi:MYXO-CTERM domain-containing protein